MIINTCLVNSIVCRYWKKFYLILEYLPGINGKLGDTGETPKILTNQAEVCLDLNCLG